MVVIVKSADTDDGRLFIDTVERTLARAELSPEQIAFDCEGVNLSRIGTVELISICFSTMEVFLVDFGGVLDRTIAQLVKQVLESSNIVKVIHDCRMDSDALFHLHGITLQNVHDTSSFHHAIAGREDKGLNDVLTYNKIATNAFRDKSIYQRNPGFWSTRPLTPTMIDWSTSDVDKLFNLAIKQLENTNERTRTDAFRKSEQFAAVCREMQIATNLRVNRVGPFIGPGGSSIQSLQRRTGTIMYQERPKCTWFAYYPDSAALESVKRAMNN